MQIEVTVSMGSGWPNGDPVQSEVLPDGRTRHTMEDGRKLTVGQPNYVLSYESTFIGAEPGETYDVNIAIVGLSFRAGFFEAWNFDTGKLRNYMFKKTEKITHLVTGEVFTGAELQKALEDGAVEYKPG